MNKLLLTLTFLFVSSIIYAQAPEGLKLRLGVRASLPISEFSEIYSYGIGGELQAELGLTERLSAVATTGYNSFTGKNLDLGLGSVKFPAFNYIPILAGIRFYATDRIFIGGQAGYGLVKIKDVDSDGAFNYQPHIGINLEKLQIALNYNVTTEDGENLSHIGLTALYKFGN